MSAKMTRNALAAGLIIGLGGIALAPAALAAEVAPAATCEGIALTSMNWATSDTHVYRVKNTTSAPVTGWFSLVNGSQGREVTVPANGDVYVSVHGTIGTDVPAKFTWNNHACSVNKSSNSWYATGHVDIEVAAEGDLAAIPQGFEVTAASSIESITWTWDGTSFVESAEHPNSTGSDRYVYEQNSAAGVARLDVPMTETYTITHDELPEGVTLDIASEPGTVPGFDESREDDAAYVDAVSQWWYDDHGKYQSNEVVVTGGEVSPEEPPVDPEEPPVTPEEPPVTPEEPPVTGGEPPVTDGDTNQSGELPHTGASPMLLGAAAAALAAGAGMTLVGRRSQR